MQLKMQLRHMQLKHGQHSILNIDVNRMFFQMGFHFHTAVYIYIYIKQVIHSCERLEEVHGLCSHD